MVFMTNASENTAHGYGKDLLMCSTVCLQVTNTLLCKKDIKWVFYYSTGVEYTYLNII